MKGIKKYEDEFEDDDDDDYEYEYRKKKKKKGFIKKIKSNWKVALSISVILFAIIVFIFAYFTYGVKKTSVDEHIGPQLVKVSELVTLRYKYSKVGKFENSKKIFGATIPFTKKSFILTYDGEMAIGLDLKKSRTITDEKSKSITIYVPNVKILSNNLKQESIKILDEETSIFNSFQLTDLNEFEKEQKIKSEEEALNDGVLDEGKKYAEEFIINFVNGILDDKDGYTVTVVFE